jgi:hypothetical protein
MFSTLLAQSGGGLQNPYIQGTFLDNKYYNPNYLFEKESNFFQSLFHFILNNHQEILFIYKNILFFLALFFLTVISYSAVRMFEIRKKEHHHLHHEIAEYAHHQKELEKKKDEREEISSNPRWVTTISYLFSQHPSDWKLAIIEADSMLEQLMEQLGFQGDTLGDKLKSANQSSFRQLASAWEVHTIRNRIAHEGGNFGISQHEAKRIIAIYEQIFRQYGFI